MTKAKRNYTQRTLKILFALSGNQCAHPDCKNPVIEPRTQKSDALVVNQICHIYALREEGPRGKEGLSGEELNAPDNLILFCPTHHLIIDGQHETYPAKLLKEWKRTHEEKAQSRLSTDLEGVQPGSFSNPRFPVELVDQRIRDDVDSLRKSRFFAEFATIRASLGLAKKLKDGELSGGTDTARSQALAWCSRFLSLTEELGKAEECLDLAKELGSCPEIEIADAFISSQKGDKNAALSALASIDSPTSRSAALLVVAHHDGSQDAVDWLKTAAIDATDLDPDGKHILLTHQLHLTHWKAARGALHAISDDDLHEAPVLHQTMAITHLLITVPNELRESVLNQLPFEAAGFPLAANAAAIKTRRIAQSHFVEAARVARQLGCPGAATINDEYALWLELMDPDESDKGKQRLEAKLRGPESALRLTRFGFQFGIKLDQDAVGREIERQIALNGGITLDAAIARFALAFMQKTPEDVANYIARHRDELTHHLDKKSIQFIQIEMLSRAGLPEKANECLENLVAEELSDAEESRLRRIIAEAEGTDPLETRKEQFRKSDSLRDLVTVVDELETRNDWDGICEYGQLLFERTRSLHDAERLANALGKTQKSERLVEFLEANGAFLQQSKNLKMLYCWSLYNEGALLKARSELAKLSDNQDDENYRALQINLGVSLGDWVSLSKFVANECLEKDKRSAQDLLEVAQLALQLGSPHAKELVCAAADKGNNDAAVLATAYSLASNAGWEDDAEAVKWLHEAATLSGDDGPIQKMTLKDVLDRKPEWDRQESETWQLLSRGDIPMFLAAQSLNKSLIDLMLFPALTSLLEDDPRQRRAVPAYSGRRQPTRLDTRGVVGMDATALLTLSFLNLLDRAFDIFDTVYVPHSTLAWLLEEKQRASHHQPSRIRDAHQLRHLLASDLLEKLAPSTVPNSDLSAQVGDELALLIAEAEKLRDDDGTQRLVVQSSPVYRLTSLMQEEADLTPHAAVLTSCQSIIDKLRQKGQITAAEEKKARAYLQLHEKPWPHQPEIADGAVLYLDAVSIASFLHLGLLDKLQAAGFRPIAPPRKISETNELISYESISSKVNDAIVRIRSAVNSRIESGRIKVGRQRNVGGREEHSPSRHPTFGVIGLAEYCDAIIVDDRFLNQHANTDDGSEQATVYSTLDLLDALFSTGSITSEERSEYRTLLRRSGYLFVPISEDELAGYLGASTVNEDSVIETAELKAVRENILSVRMSTWLQLPKEALWLDSSLKVFIRVLKGLWTADADLPIVRTRSNWILGQIDIRGWAHVIGGEDGDSIVKTGRGAHILLLITPPADAPQDIKDAYWSWVEDRVLAPIKEQHPDLYSWIVDWHRRQIEEMADTELTESDAT